MSTNRPKKASVVEHPAILVRLTPEGLRVTLVAWRHNAPVSLLAGLEVAVQRAIHEWRGRFLAEETKFGTPNLREQDQQAERTS